MTVRNIDGFEVRASVIQPDPEVGFFEPCLQVRKEGHTSEDHWQEYWAISQNVESRTQAQAMAKAEEWLAEIEYVRDDGDDWVIG